MSARLATIEPCELNCPPVSFYSTEQVKKQYSLLPHLEIPLVFGAPQPFFSDEAIANALLCLGGQIEKDILEAAETVKEGGNYLYCKHIIIRVSISVNQEKLMTPHYVWQIFYMSCYHDHVLPVRDLEGHK